MITVKATREGLIGQKTSSGYVIDATVPFVALPHPQALHLWVKVYNPANGKSCRAIVLDVGPWNTLDAAYVFQPATTSKQGLTLPSSLAAAPEESIGIRPAAESGHSLSGKGTNGAGIDLGEAVWEALGMTDNSVVSWEFD